MGRPRKAATENEYDLGLETPAHVARVKEAIAKKENAKEKAVIDEWYSFGAPHILNKKGRKVIRHIKVEGSTMRSWIGWEKKIPIGWIKSNIDLFRELTGEDRKKYGSK